MKAHDKRAAERTFTCGTCGETFHNRAPYNAHVRTAHSTAKPARKRTAAEKNTDAPAAKKSKRRDQTSIASEPAPTSAAAASSSWEADPLLIPSNLVPDTEENIAQMYRQHWPQIRTRFSRQNRLQDWYNFRLSTISPASLREQLSRIFSDQPTVFKVNFAFGFILRNTETGALQYHHPSANNNLVLEQPFLVSNQDDLDRLYQQIAEIDFLEWVRQQRPNSKWVVDLVTNVTWFVTKLRDHPIGRGKNLPHYLVENRGIDALENDKNTGKPYQDNLCFFRCLALHNGCHTKNLERDTKHYYQQYREAGLVKKKFHGVKLSELDELEKLYEVNIQVYNLAPTQTHGEEEETEDKPDIAATLLRRSHRHYESTLYLNLYEKHFSYIKDLARYSKSFCCSRCGKYWKRAHNLRQHEKTCDGKVQLKYPGGAYHVPKTIFEELEDEGIIVPEEARYFPYRATFDFECYFNKEKAEELKSTEKLNWQSAHVPLSVSVCSNVPEYQEPKCFVSSGDPKEFITEFIQYLVSISTKSSSLLREKYAPVFEALNDAAVFSRGETNEDEQAQMLVDMQDGNEESGSEQETGQDSGDESRGIDLMASDDEGDEEEIQSENEEDRAFLDEEVNENDPSFYRRINVELDRNRRQEQRQRRDEIEDCEELFGEVQTSDNKILKELAEKLNAYIQELPVLGFNSGKYDLNAVKEFLFPYLIESQPVKFTVKRNSNHMCLRTNFLKFLDITNYLAPGFSYDQFLKAYECEQTKGFFPYEWIDSLAKLEETSLPPHEAFYSSLKNQNITNEEYQYCQRVWEGKEMSTFKDFLVWYNNLDVVPFLEAVEKMSAFWQERKIDMFKDGISVPGLTLKYLFSFLDEQTYFSLFDKANSDLYHLIKDNNTGGPSIIFHRYHEAGKTKIREAEEGQDAKLCQKIVGYDANALYLWAIMQNMPTGSYTRRLAEQDFKPKGSIKMAIEWLEWVAYKERIRIRHQLNNTEKRIGDRKLPVDGFNPQTQTVYQFHGCYWHGHDCALNQGKDFNEKRKKPMAELREETKANTEYIRSKRYNVVEMYECEWRDMKRTNRELQWFVATEVRRTLDRVKIMSAERILREVRNERLFGCVEVDIRVPDHLKEKFSEMCPIFKNTNISRDDIGDFMKAYAEEHNIMAQPRRSLIGSMKGEKVLLATPLLKWYLEHGLEVTKVHQVVEFTPKSCFKSFGDAVSDARRAGDADPSKAIIADTMKLVSGLNLGKLGMENVCLYTEN